MENNDNTFNYSYSAAEQEEIKKIREKYSPRETSKIEELRKLDESVTKLASAVSITIGVIGFLLFGLGMCCVLEWSDRFFIHGIIVGVLGITIMLVSHPIYNFVAEKERERLAPRIIELTDELLK